MNQGKYPPLYQNETLPFSIDFWGKGRVNFSSFLWILYFSVIKRFIIRPLSIIFVCARRLFSFRTKINFLAHENYFSSARKIFFFRMQISLLPRRVLKGCAHKLAFAYTEISFPVRENKFSCTQKIGGVYAQFWRSPFRGVSPSSPRLRELGKAAMECAL